MQAVTAVYRGHPTFYNSAMPMVGEYMERKRLAKLGFTSPLRDEKAFVIDCFLSIDAELDRLRNADDERERLKREAQHGF